MIFLPYFCYQKSLKLNCKLIFKKLRINNFIPYSFYRRIRLTVFASSNLSSAINIKI